MFDNQTLMITGGTGGALMLSGELLAAGRRLARAELDVQEYMETGFQSTWGQNPCDLTAGLALSQLRSLQGFVTARRCISAEYQKVLCEISSVTLCQKTEAGEENGFRFVFFVSGRDRILESLHEAGIDARESISHHLSDYFRDAPLRPVMRRNAERMVSLPIYPFLGSEERERICEVLGRIP